MEHNIKSKQSLFNALGLPAAFGVVLLTFSFILLLAPYFSGSDFGIFKVPQLSGSVKNALKIIGPIAFFVSVFLFFPLPFLSSSLNTQHSRRVIQASDRNGGLDGRILRILYDYFNENPGEPEMELNELVELTKAERKDVIQHLFGLKRKGWLKYDQAKKAGSGLVWLTAPKSLLMVEKPLKSPFRFSGPIQNPADFVGLRRVITEISSHMLNLQNVSLHGERRTGKTSLLLYLAHPASASSLNLPSDHIPVYFNFMDFTEASNGVVWQAIAAAVANEFKQKFPERQLEHDSFCTITNQLASSSSAPTDFGVALKDLSSHGFKFNLLFDEFDQTVRNSDLGDTFYDALRALPTRAENVSYVIATRTGLQHIQSIDNKVSSPLFNIFTTITLRPFEAADVDSLIVDNFLRAGLDLSFAKRLCSQSDFLYKVTGFHPFFLQTYCYHLCLNLDDPDWPLGSSQSNALKAFERDAEPHFNFYWEVSSVEERRLIRRLAANEAINWNEPENVVVVEKLKDRCLAIQESGPEQQWRLFSSIFDTWVERNKIARSGEQF